MKRDLWVPLLVAALAAPSLARAQEPAPVRAGAPAYAERAAPDVGQRQALQRELFNRFMNRASNRLGLTPEESQRLRGVVAMHDRRRRDLAQEARVVRTELAHANADPSTPPAEYDRLLARMADLRARDLDLWRTEQAELGQVLNPRQRAQFMAMRLEFFDRVQRMREQRRLGAGPAAGPGPR